LLVDGQCCELFAVTAIGMRGYTPLRITGLLLIFVLSVLVLNSINYVGFVCMTLVDESSEEDGEDNSRDGSSTAATSENAIRGQPPGNC